MNGPRRSTRAATGEGQSHPIPCEIEEGTFLYTDDVTEFPRLNSVETWEIYNFTALAHPIHIHLVHFDVVGREAINPDYTFEPKIHHHHSGQDVSGGLVNLAEPPFMPRPGTTSPGPRGPERAEEGPKDTVICYPNEVTRVRAKFDLPGSYLWHCHILSHEDHDMMRPFKVVRGR